VKFRADRDNTSRDLITASRATSARSGPSFGIVGLTAPVTWANGWMCCGSDPDLVIEARCEVLGDTDGIGARAITSGS